MRLLVLGGSVFLSKAVAAEAVARGHAVTCANRGTSGAVPDGAGLVRWDRTGPVPDELTATSYDAVVDVARHPSWIRSAVAAFADAHWVFVSTISVYADESTPGGRPGTLPRHEARHEDVDLAAEPEAYGPMKVACEEVVVGRASSAMVVRPGLIAGPGDPTGRFTYWPARFADADEHPEVLAPGDPDDAVQVIDERDLATWVVAAAEQRRTGVYDAVGAPGTRREVLAAVAQGAGSDPLLTWVPQEFLVEHGVRPWAGPDSAPLWLPVPEYAGLMAHDAGPAYDAGLVTRPLAETARDTLAWLRSNPDAPMTGMSREKEAAVLAAWRDRGARLA